MDCLDGGWGPVRRCVPGPVRHTGYLHSRHLTGSGRAVPARERQHGFGTRDRARSLLEVAAHEATPAINPVPRRQEQRGTRRLRARFGPNSSNLEKNHAYGDPIGRYRLASTPSFGVRDEPALKMRRASQSANHPGTQASVNETTGSRSSALACPIATRSRRAL